MCVNFKKIYDSNICEFYLTILISLVLQITNSYSKFLTEKRLSDISKKVKVTLVQALRLCTGRTAHRGSRGIALHFHDHGTRRG